jgi:2-polyprenyl-6-methoxyphenol hydroxylase-like FAD-dependent oxidoreductase
MPSINFNLTMVSLLPTILFSALTWSLERALRTVIASLPLCDLRIGCEVVNRVEEDSSIVIEYLDRNRKKTSIRASWLVGADGKRGVVRKRFLEPEGIKQGLGL